MKELTTFSNLGDLLGSLVSPSWDWIQVEVTTRCNAACTYCPRTLFRERWPDRHMTLETFRKLVPALPRTRLVHLQGWGEPFLHPDFFEMVALAKRAGCEVGTTTNGMLLDEEIIDRLIASGMDTIAFSLAGTGEKNDLIRKGTRLDEVLEAIRSLSRAKETRKSDTPAIHIAYMLLRSNMEDVERLPQLLGGLGVSDVIVSTLDFVLATALQDETILPGSAEPVDGLSEPLCAVAAEGERYGIRIHHHLDLPNGPKEVCTENVQRALVVSADGEVSPCVYTDLVVADAAHIVGGESRTYQRLTFGNVNEETIPVIWRKKAYVAFRKSFGRGPLGQPCEGCPKLFGT